MNNCIYIFEEAVKKGSVTNVTLLKFDIISIQEAALPQGFIIESN